MKLARAVFLRAYRRLVVRAVVNLVMPQKRTARVKAVQVQPRCHLRDGRRRCEQTKNAIDLARRVRNVIRAASAGCKHRVYWLVDLKRIAKFSPPLFGGFFRRVDCARPIRDR